MGLLLQEPGDIFELEGPRTFDQDYLVFEILPVFLAEKMFRVFVKAGIDREIMAMFTEVFADTDK